jgi:hypothetical protein
MKMRRLRFAVFVTKSTLLTLTAGAALLLPAIAMAQAKHYPLESVDGLRLHNVIAEAVTLQGKKGLRVTISEAILQETLRRLEHMTPEERMQFRLDALASIEDLDFSNGEIEMEVAGAPAPGAGGDARGFVGVAFRLQKDIRTYDAFYLRPTNGRAEDQERRNHSAQYVSLPEWPWFRLRKETPGKYEAYVDVVPGEWTKIKIEVRGEKARLFVHDQEQPTLIVNDVKSGAHGKGAVALWLEPGAVAHFRDLTVKLDPDGKKAPPVH